MIADCYREANEDKAKEFACEFQSDEALALLQRFQAARAFAEESADSPDYLIE